MFWKIFKRKVAETEPEVNEVTYVLKAKVKGYTTYGDEKIIRMGSPNFLPESELIYCSHYSSQISLDPMIFARGLHKSGYYKTRYVRFKYISKIWVEEIVNPSRKTLRFISSNGIRNFHSADNGTFNSIIEIFNSVATPEPVPKEINDEAYTKCIQFIEKIVNLIESEQYDNIIESHIKFPLSISKVGEWNLTKVSKEELMANYYEKLKNVLKSINLNNPQSIFPECRRLIIGKAEFSISKEFKYKLMKIEIGNRD